MGVKVRERPDGSGIGWIFIDHQGRRKAKKAGRDKKLAEQAAKKIEARLTLGDMGLLKDEVGKKILRFKDYATTWIESQCLPPVSCLRLETTGIFSRIMS